jgi:hypothetical protein
MQSLLAQHQQKPTIKKPKLLRSNPYKLIAIKTWGIDPNLILFEDEDILVNSRRIVLNIETSLKEDEELTDYVKLRLFLAREIAMSKYREIYQSA